MTRSNDALAAAGSPLDHLLRDPLIRLVMASDRVEEADIRGLAHRLAAHGRFLDTSQGRGCAGCA